MSAKRFVHSFYDAIRGLKFTFIHEQNFRIQILLAVAVLLIAWLLPLKSWEIILIILLIISVVVMELLNTAFEYFIDLLKPRLHHYVLIVKDIMAAAVLITSLGAAIIGTLIFWPYFMNLLK
jgi:diacylglycerol kinase